jgi:hypothetical protein
MTTLCRTYPSDDAAHRAIAAVRAGGVSPHAIRLLTGREPHDIRREPVGGFAGPVAPDDPVGTFGGGAVLRRQAAGGYAGDPDGQRQGSFASSDRVVVTTFYDGAERARITGLRGARKLLLRAALDDAAVDRAVSELNKGRAVVLVDAAEIAAGEVTARLDQLARAA